MTKRQWECWAYVSPKGRILTDSCDTEMQAWQAAKEEANKERVAHMAFEAVYSDKVQGPVAWQVTNHITNRAPITFLSRHQKDVDEYTARPGEYTVVPLYTRTFPLTDAGVNQCFDEMLQETWNREMYDREVMALCNDCDAAIEMSKEGYEEKIKELERKRKFPRHADGKGSDDWTIDPCYIKEISDLIPNNDFCPSWEEIEQVLLALERMK